MRSTSRIVSASARLGRRRRRARRRRGGGPARDRDVVGEPASDRQRQPAGDDAVSDRPAKSPSLRHRVAVGTVALPRDARRHLRRLLALVLARGAGRAGGARPTSGGLDSVWVAEAWGQDAVSLCGFLAARTERIAIGTALMQIPARPPTATAMAAATIDVLSGGRFRLGLGVSGPQVSEGWYGVAVRAAGVADARVRRDRAHGAGGREGRVRRAASSTLPLPDGLGKPLRLLAEPVQERDPDLPRRDRPEGGRAGRRDRRRLAAVHGRPRATRTTLFAPLRDGPARRPGRDARRHRRRRGGPGRAGARTSTRRATPSSRCWPSTSGAMGAKEKNFYVELAERAGFGDAGARGAGRVARRATTPARIGRRARRAGGPAWRSRAARRSSTTAWRAFDARRHRHARLPSRAARTGRRSSRALAAAPVPERRPGIPGVTSPGPFPVGAYAARAARPAARRSTRVQVFGEVVGFKVGRARVYWELRDGDRRAAVLDVADGLGRARPAAAAPTASQVVAPGGCDFYPGSRTSSPGFSFAVGARPAGRRGRPAGPARRSCGAGSRPRALFAPQKALPRPALPRCIGVVTGENGKARDDVLAGLRRRGWAGRARVGVRAGAGPPRRRRGHPRAAGPRRRARRSRSIVVARGGGSLMDLFAFCDETLCRTVSMLRVPVIASVGHHTDRTLIDDVAAVSCSTPTHAAEAAVPVHCGEARARLHAVGARLEAHGRRAVLERARTPGRAVAGAGRARRAPPRAPAPAAARDPRRAPCRGLDAPRPRRPSPARPSCSARPPRPRHAAAARGAASSGCALALAAHDPQRTLERGYALVEGPDGEPVASADAARSLDRMTLRLHDGDRRRSQP